MHTVNLTTSACRRGTLVSSHQLSVVGTSLALPLQIHGELSKAQVQGLRDTGPYAHTRRQLSMGCASKALVHAGEERSIHLLQSYLGPDRQPPAL